ncbi:MAG: HNH endonuclease [Chloroflexota bacterium]
MYPKAKGGNDEEENLWLACRLCNEAKGVQIEAIDPVTGHISPLFNPRQQLWDGHPLCLEPQRYSSYRAYPNWPCHHHCA